MKPEVKVLVEITDEISPQLTSKAGKPFHFQYAYAHLGQAYPDRLPLYIPSANDARPPGKYFATNVQVDGLGLSLDLRNMTPAK